KQSVLGADTSTASVEKYSTEKHVSSFTPPTFMVHAVNDKTVNIHNSLLYYNALIDHGIDASLHTFPQGGHGIRLAGNPGSTELWLPLLHLWMKEMNFLIPLPFK
ncbi:MAG TPA: prolyl oligopeptidase family serine peptidase, partial [Niabella sp.]|nr:prolyl oligopeptidase family serine peptidase [Niabella sp.]